MSDVKWVGRLPKNSKNIICSKSLLFQLKADPDNSPSEVVYKSYPGVNFINVLHAPFSYKSLFSSYVSAKKSTFVQKCAHKTLMKLTTERWGLLIIVALLNVANCAHWISFGSVNSKAAIFYQKNVDDITRSQINQHFTYIFFV